jgi:hypothetical protein
MTGMAFSRCAAIVIGAILPIVEIYRRWHQLGDITMFPAWFDDVLISAFLLYGAWRTRHDVETGRPYLAAGWAFMAGMAYSSFFGQLMSLDQPDPSGAPATAVVVIKGLGLALAFAALAATYSRPTNPPVGRDRMSS